MLPDFPTSKREIGRRIKRKIEDSVHQKAPLLARISSSVQHEGAVFTYDRLDADPKTEGFDEIAVPFQIDLTEIPDLTGAKLLAKINAISDELAKKQMDLFRAKFAAVTQEVGNSLDAGGRPFTQDLFLAGLEPVEMEFDETGHPTLEFHASAPLVDALKEWEQDPTFMTRYNQLLDKKRNEWRDRESRRKLVD